MSAKDAEEAYEAFKIRCHAVGIEVTREDYEKFVYTKIPDAIPDKTYPDKKRKRD